MNYITKELSLLISGNDIRKFLKLLLSINYLTLKQSKNVRNVMVIYITIFIVELMARQKFLKPFVSAVATSPTIPEGVNVSIVKLIKMKRQKQIKSFTTTI